jgi:hypothetical protein
LLFTQIDISENDVRVGSIALADGVPSGRLLPSSASAFRGDPPDHHSLAAVNGILNFFVKVSHLPVLI